MADLSAMSDQYIDLLVRGYGQSKGGLPADLAEEVERRAAAKVAGKAAAVAGFWVADDLGHQAQGYTFGYGRNQQTVDPSVLAIAAYRGLSIAELTAEVQPFDTAWRGKKSGQRKKNWIAWKDRLPLRVEFHDDVLKPYLNSVLAWTPKMKVGQGTTVHLRADEVPADCLARISRYIVLIRDSHCRFPHDPIRDGERAVYGWWV
jgi:hypothetical protein